MNWSSRRRPTRGRRERATTTPVSPANSAQPRSCTCRCPPERPRPRAMRSIVVVGGDACPVERDAGMSRQTGGMTVDADPDPAASGGKPAGEPGTATSIEGGTAPVPPEAAAPTAPPGPPDPRAVLQGLDENEVAQRRAAGQRN